MVWFQLSRRLLLVVMALILCQCSEGQEIELDYGLGTRADQMGCDPASDLCWPSADVAAMQSVLASEIELAIDPDRAYRHQLELFAALDSLQHKLSAEELGALDALRDSADEPEVVLVQLDAQVLQALKGRYYATYMVPLGQSLDSSYQERADGDRESAADMVAGQYSSGVESSLARLHESGVGGNLYASMLVLSGALTRDYEPRALIGAPNGISKEEAANEIITRYKRAAGIMGLGTGATALIPVVGIVLTIPIDAFASFALQARMTFELGAVYGWSIDQGNELFTMTMFMFSDGEFAGLAGDLSKGATLPTLVRAISRQVGLTVSVPLAVKISSFSILWLVKAMTKFGAKLVAKSATKTVTHGVFRQLLGWASMGLTVVGSAVSDYYVTDRIGEHVKVVAKRWLADLPGEGQAYLQDREDRDCFFAALTELARADGRVSDAEKALFQVFLGKSYYAGDANWYQLDSVERVDHAQTLAGSASGACLASSFKDEMRPERLSVLSHLFSMAAIDLREDEAELEIYNQRVQQLRAASAWNDIALDDHVAPYVERVIHDTLHPEEIEVPEEFQAAKEALHTEDVLEFLRDLDPQVSADFECGFAGAC